LILFSLSEKKAMKNKRVSKRHQVKTVKKFIRAKVNFFVAKVNAQSSRTLLSNFLINFFDLKQTKTNFFKSITGVARLLCLRANLKIQPHRFFKTSFWLILSRFVPILIKNMRKFNPSIVIFKM